MIDVSGNSTPVSDLPCSPAMEGPNSGGQSPSLATCPACGGESHSQRERHDDPQLIIVADDRARLYELFQRAFAYDDTVHVLLDRRAAERRRRSGPSATDRRRGDRRSPTTIDGLLRATGWAAVPPGCPGASASFCPLVLSRAALGAPLLAVAGPPSAADGGPATARSGVPRAARASTSGQKLADAPGHPGGTAAQPVARKSPSIVVGERRSPRRRSVTEGSERRRRSAARRSRST